MAQAMKVAKPVEIAPGTALVDPTVAGQAAQPAVVIGGEEERTFDEQLNALASRLETMAKEQVAAKAEIEQRWIENIRAYHGTYDQNMEASLKATGQSRAFIKATRSKAVALEARLFDLIFPTDDRNWGIEATPVPKLAKELKEAERRASTAADQASQLEAQGNQEMALQAVAAGNDQADRADAAVSEIERLRRAADLMQEEMDDQLVETQYPARSRDVIRDACRLGTGILKGPMVNESTRGSWIKGEGGNYELEQREDIRPLMRRVDPWSFFPDMSAERIEEAEFTFERYLWTKRDLRKMVKTHGFDANAVRGLLSEDRAKITADSSLNYLVQLRSLTGKTSGTISGRMVGWEYHGELTRDEIAVVLRSQGQDKEADAILERDDPLEELRVIIHFCEGQILKISPEYPLDSGASLYSVFCIEEADGSIFGYGIPEIISDSQHALNSAWRMALDNAALSVGPQVVVDKTSIEPADGDWTMRARKVWRRIKGAVAKENPPFEVFNIQNNMNEIGQIVSMSLQFIDMESGLPLPQQGDQTADQTKTVGGMTILQNAANIVFRRIVKNYDDGIIAPTMRRLYDWNMQFNQNPEIKGDMQVDARGTAVLLLKEIQAQNLMFAVVNLLNHGIVSPMLKPFDLVTKLFQSMMIAPADVMLSKGDYEKRMAELAKQPPPKSPQEIAAEARLESAKITADSRRETNETQERIAQLKERTALLDLAQREGLSMEELRNELQLAAMDHESKERIKGVEIAVEDERARQAREEGRDETDATGQGIG